MSQRVAWFEGDASWRFADDTELVAAHADGRPATILYLDRMEYAEAVMNLSPEEIQAAVHRRRETFRVASRATVRVLEGVRAAMVHAAQAGDARSFETLNRLAVPLYDGGRFERLDLVTLLSAVLDADARMVAEATELPLGHDKAALGARYELDARAMADAGRPQYTRGLLYVARPRLFRIFPYDKDFLFAFHDEMHVVLPDAVLGPWRSDDLDVLAEENRTVELLAFDPSPLPSLMVRTPPQVERDVGFMRNRASAYYDVMMEAYGRDLRQKQHWMRRRLAETVQRDPNAATPRIVEDVAREETELMALLSRAPREQTPTLADAARQARDDAAFFATVGGLPATARALLQRTSKSLEPFTQAARP